MGRYNSDSNVQISDKAVEAGKNVISDIQKEKGRYPNFEDFINYFIERHGKDTIEQKFNNLSFLAKKLGLDTSLASEYYDRTFNSTQDVLIFDEEATDTPINPQLLAQQEELFRKELAYKSFEPFESANSVNENSIEKYQQKQEENSHRVETQENTKDSEEPFQIKLSNNDKEIFKITPNKLFLKKLKYIIFNSFAIMGYVSLLFATFSFLFSFINTYWYFLLVFNALLLIYFMDNELIWVKKLNDKIVDTVNSHLPKGSDAVLTILFFFIFIIPALLIVLLIINKILKFIFSII